MKNSQNNKFAEKAAKKANIDVNELKKAAESGNVDDFINKNLSSEASQKLKSILSDKSAMEKMMQTPQAKELLEKLMKG